MRNALAFGCTVPLGTANRGSDERLINKYEAVCVDEKNKTKLYMYCTCTSYTHFAYPVHGYADLIVHRLLSASMGFASVPMRLFVGLRKAEFCNYKREINKQQRRIVISEKSLQNI